MALVDTGRRTELLYDFYSGRLRDWGLNLTAGKSIPLVTGSGLEKDGVQYYFFGSRSFLPEDRSTGIRSFSIFRATSSQNSSRLLAKSIIGGAFFGHLSLESFPWWGSDARSAGEGIWAPFFWRLWAFRSAVPTQWPWLLTA